MRNIETRILGGTKGLGLEIAKAVVAKDILAGVDLMGRSYPVEKNNIKGLTTYTKVDLNSDESLKLFLGDAEYANFKRFFWVAGSMLKGDFDKHDRKSITDVIEVNFRNPVLVAQKMWKFLQETGGESFVVIASTSGLKPREDEAIYAATKAAQVQFTRSLGLESDRIAKERGTKPVKVSLFMPGGMRTNLWDNYPDVSTEGFLDPSKVAEVIVNDVYNQTETYFEREIPRGSL